MSKRQVNLIEAQKGYKGKAMSPNMALTWKSMQCFAIFNFYPCTQVFSPYFPGTQQSVVVVWCTSRAASHGCLFGRPSTH